VCGYLYVQPWLERRFGLHDTCGVHNLHGLPGLLGAVGGAVSAALAGDSHVAGDEVNDIFPKRAPPPLGDGRSAGGQGLYQLAALVVALVLAVAGGWLAGKVASLQLFAPLSRPWQLFEDEMFWELPKDEVHDDNTDNGRKRANLEEEGVKKTHGSKDATSVAKLKLQLLELQEAIDRIDHQQPAGSP